MGKSVHPRVCGEHTCFCDDDGEFIGSSPRVRGTLPLDGEVKKSLRFIPACAGNTSLLAGPCNLPPVHPRVCGEHPDQQLPPMPSSVHPRVCGEHPSLSPRNAVAIGSSPRVRGTLITSQSKTKNGRFIPACAGNTCAKT